MLVAICQITLVNPSCRVLDRERQELLRECYYWSKENVDWGGRLLKRPNDPELKDLSLKDFFFKLLELDQFYCLLDSRDSSVSLLNLISRVYFKQS